MSLICLFSRNDWRMIERITDICNVYSYTLTRNDAKLFPIEKYHTNLGIEMRLLRHMNQCSKTNSFLAMKKYIYSLVFGSI